MLYGQTILVFDAPAADRLAQAGIDVAGDNADRVRDKWRADCWRLFWQWLNKKPRYFQFQVEDFRMYLQEYDLLELPPSNRAFAFLVSKARKDNLIEYVRDEKVNNTKAHGAKAAVWMKR